MYRRLLQTALLWAKKRADLLSNVEFADALNWKAKEHPDAAWAERYGGDFDKVMQFLAESEIGVSTMSEASPIDGQHVLPEAERELGGRRGEGDGPSRPIPYQEQFKREMGELIDSLALDDLEKRYLRSRWLDQTVWMEARAEQARKRYYVLQLLTIGGGVSIPALVSLDSVPSGTRVAHWAAFGIGLLVALTTAVEGFFHFGDRWKQYRRTAELLKAEGWRFSQRSGSYQSAATHKEAFPAFADRVEQLIQKDVDVYFTEVVKTKKDENPEPATT